MDKQTYKKAVVFVFAAASLLLNVYLIDEREDLKDRNKELKEKTEQHQDVAWEMYKKYRKLKAKKCYKDIVR